MLTKIPFLLNEARVKLKPLGLALFYLYFSLMMSAAAGFIYALIVLIQKLVLKNAFTLTPWWEILSLLIISPILIKIFYKELLCLLDLIKIKSVVEYQDEEEVHENSHNQSNVIPLRKKSRHQDS
jgi:hypothetical protein